MKTHSILPLILGLIIIIIDYSLCNEKQTKVSACMKIFKARMMIDGLYFQTFIETLAEAGDKKDEAQNRILSLCLLNCYNQIEFYRADEINKKFKDYKKIPAMDDEYKELLGLEKWYEILTSKDNDRMQQEMSLLQEAAQDIKSEELNFDDSSSSSSNGGSDDPEAQDIYVNREKKLDLDIFGFNITQLDNTTKNVLGLSLIVFIFSAVIYGLNWIKNLRKKEVKVKKNKKKN